MGIEEQVKDVYHIMVNRKDKDEAVIETEFAALKALLRPYIGKGIEIRETFEIIYAISAKITESEIKDELLKKGYIIEPAGIYKIQKKKC